VIAPMQTRSVEVHLRVHPGVRLRVHPRGPFRVPSDSARLPAFACSQAVLGASGFCDKSMSVGNTHGNLDLWWL
jgi:hypothetical protein